MATEPAGMCVRLQSLTTVPPKAASSKPSAGMVAGVVVGACGAVVQLWRRGLLCLCALRVGRVLRSSGKL